MQNNISSKRLGLAYKNLTYKKQFNKFYCKTSYLITQELKWFTEKTASFSLNTLNNLFGKFRVQKQHNFRKRQKFYLLAPNGKYQYKTIATACFQAQNDLLLRKLLKHNYASQRQIKSMYNIAKELKLGKFVTLFEEFISIALDPCKKVASIISSALNNRFLSNNLGTIAEDIARLGQKSPPKPKMKDKKKPPLINKQSHANYNKSLDNLVRKKNASKELSNLSLADKKAYWLRKLQAKNV